MLNRELDIRTEQLTKQGLRLRGRQMLRLVYNLFRAYKKTDHFYNIIDVTNLRLKNDNL